MAFVLLALSSEACVSTASFTSARTLEPGDVRHTLGASMYLVREDGDRKLVPLPMPMYGITYGLAKEVDFTAQIAAPARLRGEVKYNPIRTDTFDVAIAPALYFGIFPSSKAGDNSPWLLGAELPVVADFNMSSSVSLVGWFGPAYAYAPGINAGAPYFRTGSGVSFRGDGYTVQPEVSLAYDPARRRPIDINFGVGFTFGDMPAF